MHLYWNIGDVVVKLRMMRQMTARELARASRVGPNVITNLERGRATRVETLAKIATALDCTVTDLRILVPPGTSTEREETRPPAQQQRDGAALPQAAAFGEAMNGSSDQVAALDIGIVVHELRDAAAFLRDASAVSQAVVRELSALVARLLGEDARRQAGHLSRPAPARPSPRKQARR